MSISDISALLLGSTLEETLCNIVAFFAIVNFIGLIFLFLANLTRVNR